MAAPTWTDREVAFLLTAHDIARISKEGRWYQGFRSEVEEFEKAEDRFRTVAEGGTRDRDAERAALKKARRLMYRAMCRADRPATVTPEDTLREAGVTDERQAAYQRRMSSLLGKRGA
jgi:hypothetical protein